MLEAGASAYKQMKKPFYRQKLPHKQSYNASYFVTYRLAGSIPISIFQQLKEACEWSLKELVQHKQFTTSNEYKLQRKYVAQFDSFLDTNLNDPYWLQQAQIAQIVNDSLLHLDGKEINSVCFTIMSNHVQALFSIENDNDLFKIMQLHKSFTAKKYNAILKRSGPFWETESYDHIVRPGEWDNIVNYIL